MSTTTAIITLGSTGMSPGVSLYATAELHEGGVNSWVLRLHTEGRNLQWTARPGRSLVVELLSMLAIHLLDFRDGVGAALLQDVVDGDALEEADHAALDAAAEYAVDKFEGAAFVTIFDGSALAAEAENFRLLREGDVTIHRAVYERYATRWGSGDVVELGHPAVDPLAAVRPSFPDDMS